MYQPEYIRVVLKDMPVTIQGFTVSDGFDFYTIFINARLSSQMQIDVYDHELEHIENGDFSRMQDINRDILEDSDVNILENIRHK